MRPFPHFFLVIALSSVTLCGCLTREPESTLFPKPAKPVARTAPAAPAPGTAASVPPASEPAGAEMAMPTGPLSPADLMALAIRRGRLDDHLQRLRAGVEAVSRSGNFDDLKNTAVGAGYPDAGPGRFGVLSAGDDSPRRELGAIWDALDLALAATTPGGSGTGDDTLQARAWHNLLAEVRSLWYRAAIADILVPEIDALMARGRSALQSAAGTGGPARDATTFRTQIIENNRRLWTISERLTSARAEIAAMLNAPSAADIQIRPPDWGYLDADPALTPADDLDILALSFRREPGISVTATSDRAVSARREIEKLMPSGRDWRQAALRLAQTPARTASGPMTDQYVVAQVHLARQSLDAGMEAWRTAHAAVPPDAGGAVSAKTPDEDRSRELAVSRKGVDRMMAKLREYLAHAEADAALHRVHRTLGLAETPVDARSGTDIDTAMSHWSRVLTLASAAQGDGHLDVFKTDLAENRRRERSSAASAPAPAASPAAASAGVDRSIPAASPPAGAPPPAIRPETADRKAVIVSASAAEAKGQLAARTISVYRDVVNIHESPSKESPVVGQGLIGEEYRLLGWSPDGWVQIEVGNGLSGWMPTRFVRPEEAAPNPPPPSADKKDKSGKAAKPPAASKKEETVKKEESAKKEAPAKKEEPAKKEAPAAKPVKASSRLTTTDRANLRGGPGLNYEVKYIAPAGTTFEVVRTSGEWFLVRDGKGTDGWLHQSVVNGGR